MIVLKSLFRFIYNNFVQHISQMIFQINCEGEEGDPVGTKSVQPSSKVEVGD